MVREVSYWFHPSVCLFGFFFLCLKMFTDSLQYFTEEIASQLHSTQSRDIVVFDLASPHNLLPLAQDM